MKTPTKAPAPELSSSHDTMGGGNEASEKEFLEIWTKAIHWLSDKTAEKIKRQPEIAKFQEMNFEMMTAGINHYKTGFYDALNLMHEWKKI